jgi:hypothetical protein
MKTFCAQHSIKFAKIASLLLIAVSSSFTTRAITLAWDANTEPDLAGYNLYYSETNTPTQKINVGAQTSCVVSNLTSGKTYGFFVTAYNTAGLESQASAQILYTVPSSTAAPVISNIPDQVLSMNQSTAPISFTVSDSDTAAANLTLSGASSNPALLPNANIVFGGSGTSRTVKVTPAPNQSGSATITVTVSDGPHSASDSFLLTVNQGNTPPSISNISNLAINEDSTAGPISFSVNDAETSPGALSLTATSSNGSLVPNANIVLGGSGASRTLSISPAPNQSGSANITVTVSDGSLTASDLFTLTVNPINDPPFLSDISNRTINEDSYTGAIPFLLNDVDTASSNLVLTASSSNVALVPQSKIVFAGSGTNRTISVTPAANQSGSATITVTASDGSLTASDTFVLNVTPVNDPPFISNLSGKKINEDSTLGPISFAVGDVDTATTNLVVTATSGNSALVPNSNITLGGSGTNRTLTIRPLSNQNGTARITIKVSDGSLSVSDRFTLTVSAVNDPPVLAGLSNQSIAEDSPVPLPFTISDVDTALTNLTLRAFSSNPALVPANNIVFAGSGTNRTVTARPLTNQFGSAAITLTLSDGSLTVSNTFSLNVSPVNDAPTISDIPDQTISMGASAGPISFTIGDVDSTIDSLQLSGTSSNPTLVPNSNISFGGSGANRSVTVTPAPLQTGTATITVSVSDGSLTTRDSFVLTVNSPVSGVSQILSQPLSATALPNDAFSASLQLSSSGEPVIQVKGSAEQSYIVEASSDLTNWTSIGSTQVGASPSLKDIDKRSTRRFYRIRKNL